MTSTSKIWCVGSGRFVWTTSIIFIALIGWTQACHGQESSDESQKLSPRELMIAHAKTNRDLAEIELRQALDLKEAVPKLTVERLRSNLAVADEQLKQASLASTGGPEQVRLRHAEERIRVAKLEFDVGGRLRASGAISDLELERRKLNHELAKLNLMMMKNPENFVTLMENMQRRLDRFGEEILSLDQRISKLESN